MTEIYVFIGFFTLFIVLYIVYVAVIWLLENRDKNAERVALLISLDSKVVDSNTRLREAQTFLSEIIQINPNVNFTFEIVKKQKDSLQFYLTFPQSLHSDLIISRVEKLTGVLNIEKKEPPDFSAKVSRNIYAKRHYENFKVTGNHVLEKVIDSLDSLERGAIVMAFRSSYRREHIKGKIKSLNIQSKQSQKVDHNVADTVKQLKRKIEYPLLHIKITLLVDSENDVKQIKPAFKLMDGDNEFLSSGATRNLKDVRFLPKEDTLNMFYYWLYVSILGHGVNKFGSVLNAQEASELIAIPQDSTRTGAMTRQVAE